jgi:hypothetical protein
MYDPEGSDTDREWVEILNNGGTPIDLSEKSANNSRYSRWRFREKDSASNHSLILVSGSATIQPGEYAVITNSDSALVDFPGYSGALFTASFSLLNSSSEVTMAIRDDNSGLDVSTIKYSKDSGATEDGNSLQVNSLGELVAALPTPGTGFSHEGDNVSGAESTDASANSPAPDNNTASGSEPAIAPDTRWSVEPQVFADAGKDRTVVVGAGAVFEGKALGLKKEPLQNARYIWNFGDGATGEGKMVEHTYRHPGDYLVVMEAASGYYSGQDRLKVRAEPSPLSVSSITNGSEYFVELANSSKTNIDISMWGLALNGKVFAVPKNTFVMAGKKLIFPNEVTGLLVEAGSAPALHYPNGTLASRFGEEKEKAVKAVVGAAPVSGQQVISAKTVSSVPETADKKGVKVAQAAEGEPRISGVRAEENNQAPGNMAAVAESLPKKASTNYVWLLGVVGVSAIALAGVFFARKLEQPDDESQKIADEIEIIED